VDVAVYNLFNGEVLSQTVTLSKAFTYIAAPTVGSINPNSGPTTGGTTVTITGTGLTGATAVDFGTVPATGFTVNGNGTITVTSPAGAGIVNVTVTTPGGTSATGSSDQFTYIAAPTVGSITPTSGPTTGGTTVIITGTGFATGATVSFGDTPATSVVVVNGTTITATSPAGTGTVDVTVTTGGGTSATNSGDQFTYTSNGGGGGAPGGGGGGGGGSSLPVITGISPATGSTAGGASVTINGNNLSGATAVDFGKVPATSFKVNAGGTITAVVPAGTAGDIDVFVTTAAGTSSVNHPDDLYDYTAVTPIPIPTPAQGQIFSDVPSTFWGYGDIEGLSSGGIVSGYPDGTFGPNQQITRAEMATIMDKVLKLNGSSQQTPTFTDVDANSWYDQAVETSVYAGIFKGYGDGTFHPNAPISRQEIACVLVQALRKSQLADANAQAVTKFLDDNQIGWWSRGYIYVALQQGIVSGYPDNTFEPKAETTRAEACAMVANFLKAIGSTTN
jgi:hypothetical protein